MKLTVYHGSLNEFSQPNLGRSKDYRDFGNGFYVTENYYDALNILNYKSGFLYEYELDLSNLIAKELVDDEELINYIIKNRTSIIKEDYDVVIGKTLCGCAKIFKQIRNNQISIDKKALFKLLNQTPYDQQICLKTKLALSKLKLTNVHYYSSEDFE